MTPRESEASLDTIAVVGASDRALALLGRLAESRFEVVSFSTRPEWMRVELRKRLPAARRADWLVDVRFVSDLDELESCSIVVDAHDPADGADEANRARALVLLERHMSTGAVLASATADAERIAAVLERPTQFVALASIGSAPEPVPVDATAPGALFAAERLCASVAPKPLRARRESSTPDAIELV